jgi:class 3 adenylate cyclase
VEEIIADPSRLQPGGINRRMTAMFSDLQDFTRIAERLSAEETVSFLNQYLSAMSDVILKEKGTIDKFEGDAIITFFGAPQELPDHAARACSAAILMKRLENELNKTFIAQGTSPVLTRIGINTGSMVVGNMGTERKMNYTIIGNEVNLASRLEGVNKIYGTWIIASESTVRECPDHVLVRRLDRIRVVGIREPVRIYEILELSAAASPEMRERAGLFHAALDAFEARDWKSAENAFARVLEQSPGDGPSLRYLERARRFQAAPPEPDWDGVYNISEK